MKDIAKVYIIIVLIAVVFGFGMWIVNDVLPVLLAAIIIAITWLWTVCTTSPVSWVMIAVIVLYIIQNIIEVSVKNAIRENEIEKATNSLT
jgi:hypothetical protein